MVYELSWLVENQVLDLVMQGEIDLDTIEAMSKDILHYLEVSDAPLVHLLIDDEYVTSSIKHVRSVVNVGTAMRHPRFGWLLMYGTNNKVFEFMTYLISQMTKIRHRRFSTRAEALEFLRTVDSTLPRVVEILSQK